MNTRKILLLTTALASLSLMANSANAAEGYASIFGGASLLQDQNMSGTSHTHSTTYVFKSTQSLDTSFKTGFVVGGNFGVKWDSGLRTELELAVRQNSSKRHGHLRTTYSYGAITGTVNQNTLHLTSSTDRAADTDLRLRAYSLMANAWYDFDIGSSFTPYIGGGIGLAEVQIDGSIDSARIAEKNDMVFAWQVGAGVAFPLTDSIKAFADYRYFAADAARLRLEPGYHGGNVSADFNSHLLMVGLRFGL